MPVYTKMTLQNKYPIFVYANIVQMFVYPNRKTSGTLNFSLVSGYLYIGKIKQLY